MKNLLASLAVLCAFMMASTSLLAHHGTGASYDMHKVVVLKGVVTQFNFANPHSQLYFDVKDNGKVVHWSAEMRNPRNLESFGYTKHFLMDKFAPGAAIEIYGNPSKSGTPVLVFGKATTSDGWCLCNHQGGLGSDAIGAVGQGVE